ncbi:hypothetical protein WJX73_010367 [Symbiochloris irregularis]|uniref:Acylamino-acid-releasing enzyme n=1 Tax=Symbiochloris irregularis TaxID=706552 RepID=A0AAW1PA05_9CHLO
MRRSRLSCGLSGSGIRYSLPGIFRRPCAGHPCLAFLHTLRTKTPGRRLHAAPALQIKSQMAEKEKIHQSLPEELPGMEAEARLLAGFLEIPSISRAWCSPAIGDSANLTVQFGQRNVTANSQRKYISTYLLPAQWDGKQAPVPGFPFELKDVGLMSWSPSGSKGLVTRAGTEGNSAVLEVWGHGRLLRQLNVPKALHGPVVNDGWFASGAAWSPDESQIAYVAEAAPAKQTPLWCGPDKQAQKDDKVPAAAPAGFRGQGEFQEDWGELNTGKRAPAIFILDVASGSVRQAKGLPGDCSAGQPVWTPDGKELVVTVWGHSFPQFGRRLGIVYCMNRPCSLHRLPVQPAGDAQAPASQVLTPEDGSAMSARFSPDGSRLVFLSHLAAVQSGTHGATTALCTLQWPPASSGHAEVQTVVDVVQRPASNAADAFPGLYLAVLPAQPFLGPSTLLLTSQWRSSSDIVCIDLESGAARTLRPADSRGAWGLLTIGQGWVVATHSAPNQPPQIRLARQDQIGDRSCTWHTIQVTEPSTLQEPVADAMQAITFQTLKVKPTNGDKSLPCEAILLQGQTGKPAPTLLFPHGGPHSAYPDGFWPTAGFLCALGYNVILVNFRGSLGFGESTVQSLPGNIGDHDVADCIASLDAVIALGCVDESRIAVMGGSHGGLLTGHLVGQHPQRFKCAVLRNPVMDISAMIHLTDIPDWCYVECWGSEEGKKRMSPKPTAEDLACFLAHSPATHADKAEFETFLNHAWWFKEHMGA